MNMFTIIFWATVVADVLVPTVNVGLGWYIMWGLLAAFTHGIAIQVKRSYKQ